MMDLFFLPFFLFGGFLSLLGTLFWLWMLIDCAVKEPGHDNTKIVWILIIIFLPFIGSLIYFLIRRSERMRLHGA